MKVARNNLVTVSFFVNIFHRAEEHEQIHKTCCLHGRRPCALVKIGKLRATGCTTYACRHSESSMKMRRIQIGPGLRF